MRKKWNHETVALEAKKYEIMAEFRANANGAVKYARRHNILDEITTHMNNKRIYWTKESCQVEALKFETRYEFQVGSSAYQYAYKQGIVDEVCSHMDAVRATWTKESCHSVALKYETRKDFQTHNNGAYKHAFRGGILDEVCSHMDAVRATWTKELCHSVALKYETRGAFQDGSHKGAYNYAWKNGLLDEVCSHMVDGSRSDEDMVYLWRIPNTNICKIGLSSVRLGDERVVDVANAMKVDYEILTMCHVPNAREVEAELHKEYQILPTTLPKADGYTEFRILSEANINEITYYLENIVGDVV